MNEELKVRYQTEFNPKIFTATYHGRYDFELKWNCIDFLHDVFANGKAKGQTMIDVGCGPIPQGAISASKHVPEIYLCDLAQKNREQLNKWLSRVDDSLDYSSQFEHVAKLEDERDWNLLEERSLKAVKEVIPGDITHSNPIQPMEMQFDIVASFCCLECYPIYEDYCRYLRNVISLIVPGGTYLSSGYLESSEYCVGDVSFPASSIDAVGVRQAILDAGMKIVEFHEYRNVDNTIDFWCNPKAVYTVIAKKPNDTSCQ